MTPSNFTGLPPCGAWPMDGLAAHGIVRHDHEWMDDDDSKGTTKCCPRRSSMMRNFTPESEATLNKQSVRLLMVIVADSSNATRSLALSNIAAFSQLKEVSSSFLLVVDHCNDWTAVVAASTRVLHLTVECVEHPETLAVRTPEDDSHPIRPKSAYAFRPKLPLQIHGLETLWRRSHNSGLQSAEADLLDGYDAVWLPDADIAFTAEGISALLLRWACAFEAGPPLVAQPAMHGDVGRTGRSQQFWHLNYGREWQPTGRLAAVGTHAMHTIYVEQQAPILDAGFLQWFIANVGRPLAGMQQAHGTDMGTDELWCRAAHSYARLQQLRRGRERPGCAVIPTPFRHRGVQRKRPPHFWRGSGAVRTLAAARWPQFWLDHGLLRMHRLSSEHVEESLRLPDDRCMVRLTASTRLGYACR